MISVALRLAAYFSRYKGQRSKTTRSGESPSHLSVIGGALLQERYVRYAALVRCRKFRGFPLLGSRKCIASTRIAVGTSTEVRHTEEVRYWEGPLSEVPLYIYKVLLYFMIGTASRLVLTHTSIRPLYPAISSWVASACQNYQLVYYCYCRIW